LKTNSAIFDYKSVCITLVALRINLHQAVALSFRKVGDPCCTGFGVKRNIGLAKFLASCHVRMHGVIFYISNTLRKLMI